MDKIDTQGLSGPVTKGCTDNVYPHDEKGDPILPKGEWKELPIFTDKERKEFHNKPDLPDYRPFRLDELQE